MIFSFFLRRLRAWRQKRQAIYAAHCLRLEGLLHEIIDLAFVYEENHTLFFRKFTELVNVKSLTKRGLIDPDALLRTPRYNRDFNSLKRCDAELLALLAAGFSNRELKVIFGLKNLNSVYIKNHRVRSRLSAKMRQLLDDRSHIRV